LGHTLKKYHFNRRLQAFSTAEINRLGLDDPPRATRPGGLHASNHDATALYRAAADRHPPSVDSRVANYTGAAKARLLLANVAWPLDRHGLEQL
jgi:hypothetical protein